MGTNQSEVERKSEKELKHLGFVRIAAIQAFVCVSNLYQYAKHNSGPLRSAVGAVEGTVSAVLGPVYNKFRDVPDDLLVFVDNKVDEASQKFEEHAPPLVKQVARQAKGLIEEVTQKAEKVVSEAQSGGAKAAAHYVAEESKHIVLTGSVKLWNGLNHYQLFHAVAEMAVPTAAHWLESYNHVVEDMTAKGYGVFQYLPLVPIDEIAKAFKQGEGEANVNENGDGGVITGQIAQSE
ncbi:REF/SRPP-like protein At1g67360 [Arachis ipaensis]|uniref:REF/SRPP-like protein At1g67360 n=1 Tax=Arachis ipaensis TaxID=130454 RepID=UPI0007AFB5CD|nr:REF/SRPP-like protein At1g67360 [Arachis ipaensis]XP_025640127.1 REF/SRPP-like protein At1g67360 [Arachis hypogaea]QHO60332.1 REF/SRPP-like protein [Arachis hypogaea]